MVVHGKHHVARKALKQTVRHHGLGAAVEPALFRWLKNQVQRTGEVSRGRKVLCRTKEHGSVAVVPAGVHEAGPAAGVWKPGVFLDRQGIHVGTQAKTPVTLSHA